MNFYFPISNWLPNYRRSFLPDDLSAGITVGIMLIPQGMAYAMLAGLPPIYGLYAATLPLIVYAILGTSRHLAVGPVAMVSLLVASGVGAIADIGTESFISLSILLALMVGVFQFLLGVFRIGFIVNFLSHPVISGFTTAAALIIGFSQLKHLLGIDISRGKVHETIIAVTKQIQEINIPTLLIGLGAVVLILFLKHLSKKIPSPLIVVVLGSCLVYFLNLQDLGVSIIKDVPRGLPSFSIPKFDGSSILSLMPIAVTIAAISYMESFAVAKAIQNKHKDYSIDPNQELISLGASNIIGSLFNGFPVTGGFSRTAVNDQAGAKTQLAAIISAAIVLLTLLFLTPYFYYLPKAVLAAIILVAVYGLIDIQEAKYLWKHDKIDFVTFLLTAGVTLLIGIEPGIGVGVLFSIILVVYRVAYPHITELAQIPESNTFRSISRFENLNAYDSSLILRFDAQLFFGNCQSFKNSILHKVEQNENLKYVIIEASGIHHIDSSSIHMLKDLYQDLIDKEIQLQFADVKGPLRDLFDLNGIYKLLGESNFYLTVLDSIQYNELGKQNDKVHYTTQKNKIRQFSINVQK